VGVADVSRTLQELRVRERGRSRCPELRRRGGAAHPALRHRKFAALFRALLSRAAAGGGVLRRLRYRAGGGIHKTFRAARREIHEFGVFRLQAHVRPRQLPHPLAAQPHSAGTAGALAWQGTPDGAAADARCVKTGTTDEGNTESGRRNTRGKRITGHPYVSPLIVTLFQEGRFSTYFASTFR